MICMVGAVIIILGVMPSDETDPSTENRVECNPKSSVKAHTWKNRTSRSRYWSSGWVESAAAPGAKGADRAHNVCKDCWQFPDFEASQVIVKEPLKDVPKPGAFGLLEKQ